MFSQDYAEYSKKEIELKEIDSTALEHLINFAYSGSIRIDTANCQSIMIGASFLQLNKVRDACAQFLIQKYDELTREFSERLTFSYFKVPSPKRPWHS